MIHELSKIIEEIREDITLRVSDEASIKSAVVQRLLHILGWNVFDINEVQPEFSVESRRVDFALSANHQNKVFIEVKRPDQDLERHQEQLLDYAFRQGIKLAILTNGLTWWFYLPLNEGGWEQRRFYTADILEQEPSSIANIMADLLSNENIVSGKSYENAEAIFKNRQKKNILKQAIPKAWDKIITEPDELLVDLIVETTEKLSGFRPDIEDVEEYLANLNQVPKRSSSQIDHHTKPKRITKYQTGSFINKKIEKFKLIGNTYYPKTWKELLVTVSEEMIKRHPSEFDRALQLRGSKMTYISTNSNEMSQPVQILDSKYFVETKLNSNSIVQRSRDLMSLFGYSENELEIITK